MECGLRDQNAFAKDSTPLCPFDPSGGSWLHSEFHDLRVIKGLAWPFPYLISWLEWVDNPILDFDLALSTTKVSNITLKGSTTFFFISWVLETIWLNRVSLKQITYFELKETPSCMSQNLQNCPNLDWASWVKLTLQSDYCKANITYV